MPTGWGDPVILEPESRLYEPFERYLKLGFLHHLKPRCGSIRLIPQVVSRDSVVQGGMWSQPDVVAVAVSKFKYATAPRLEIYSFEVKPQTKGNLAAVHQSLAHAKFANYSYLVWNRSADMECDDKASAIVEACRAYGVGLILAHDPNNMSRYLVAVDAERQELSAAATDEFIETRFSQDNQAKIMDGLRSLAIGSS